MRLAFLRNLFEATFSVNSLLIIRISTIFMTSLLRNGLGLNQAETLRVFLFELQQLGIEYIGIRSRMSNTGDYQRGGL